MVKRTYEDNAKFINEANDLDNYIVDKRVYWRASPSKAIRRNRRYQKRLINQIIRLQK